MRLYLIVYGAESEMATFMAENVEHAIEQFINWSPVSAVEAENRDAITDVYMCVKETF